MRVSEHILALGNTIGVKFPKRCFLNIRPGLLVSEKNALL